MKKSSDVSKTVEVSALKETTHRLKVPEKARGAFTESNEVKKYWGKEFPSRHSEEKMPRFFVPLR